MSEEVAGLLFVGMSEHLNKEMTEHRLDKETLGKLALNLTHNQDWKYHWPRYVQAHFNVIQVISLLELGLEIALHQPQLLRQQEVITAYPISRVFIFSFVELANAKRVDPRCPLFGLPYCFGSIKIVDSYYFVTEASYGRTLEEVLRSPGSCYANDIPVILGYIRDLVNHEQDSFHGHIYTTTPDKITLRPIRSDCNYFVGPRGYYRCRWIPTLHYYRNQDDVLIKDLEAYLGQINLRYLELFRSSEDVATQTRPSSPVFEHDQTNLLEQSQLLRQLSQTNLTNQLTKLTLD
jgi:hypothetical protein